MVKAILAFADIKIKKKKHHKSSVSLKDVNIEKVLVCKKISSGEKNYKYFIGYLYNDYILKLLHIMLEEGVHI